MSVVFNCGELMALRGAKPGEECFPEDSGSALTIKAPEGKLRVTSFQKEPRISTKDLTALIQKMMISTGVKAPQPVCNVYWETSAPDTDVAYLEALRRRISTRLADHCLSRIYPLASPLHEYGLSVLCPCASAQDASEKADLILDTLREAFLQPR